MLWTNIVYNGQRGKKLAYIIARNKIFLSRSRKSPILLHLALWVFSERSIKRVPDIVMPHIQRCWSLRVEGMQSNTLMERFPLPAPMQHLLEIHINLDFDYSRKKNPGCGYLEMTVFHASTKLLLTRAL